MNYIQRLFDAVAPAATVARPAPMAGGPGVSPIVAADQRLGIFPDLMDPFVPRPAHSDTVEAGPPPKGSRTRHRRAPPVSAAAPQNAKVLEAGLSRTRKKSPSRAPPYAAAGSPEMHASALQRLVESDPLPAPATLQSRATAPAPATPVQRREPDPDAADPPSAPPPTALSERFRIAPNQLQPADFGDDARLPSSQRSLILEPKEPPLPAATPLMPSNHEVQALAAAWLDIFRSPAAAPRDESSATTEREPIVERIREVAVTPSAPPRPMTAAGQSVIGSLDGRTTESWRPRQESL